MGQFEDAVQIQTREGAPIAVGDVTLTPQAQSLSVRWPGGGWVWNRPLAAVVTRGDQEDRIPIVDVTRIAQIVMLGITLACALLMWSRARRERSNQDG